MKPRTLHWLVPAILIIGWAGWYFVWRVYGAGQHSRPLINVSKQWYIGRDGHADAEADIHADRMKLYQNTEGFSDFHDMNSYRRILQERYSVKPTSIFEGDVIPDKYVLPYIHSYNATITDYLKKTYGADIMERISSESKNVIEID